MAIKIEFHCEDCDKTTSHCPCHSCGSHEVTMINYMNLATRKNKKEDYK